MNAHNALLLAKFASVVVFAIGIGGAFTQTDRAARKRAVHGVASPGLLGVWLSGFLLASEMSLSLMEPWLLAGLVLSFASQSALVVGCTREHPPALSAKAAVMAPLLLVLAFMIWKPTW